MESPDRRFVISEDVVHRELEGEAVILSLSSGLYYGLNPTGTHVWRLVEQGAPLAEIIESVSRAFAHPADSVERDVLALLAELQSRSLVHTTPAAPGA